MRRRRLIILAFHLRHVGGHHLTEVEGYRNAVAALGMALTVYAPATCDPAVAAMVSAERMIPEAEYPPSGSNDLLEALPSSAAAFDPIWDDIVGKGLATEDIIYFTHGNPMALFDLSRRLGGMPNTARPAVFVTFLGAEFREPNTARPSQGAVVQRFIARLLATTPGQERIFYTLTNHRQAGTLARVCSRRVIVMPMPEGYGGPLFTPPSRGNRRFTVYFHVTEFGAMERCALDVAERLLKMGHDLDFIFKFARHGRANSGDVPATGIPRERMRVILGSPLTEEYLAAIGGADMVVLPYPRPRYQVISSGAFCEAVGFGAVVVVPRDTWPGDRVEDGSGAGVLFDEVTPDSIARAADEALRRRSELIPLAAARAGPFRKAESCAAALDRMLELAASPPDMRADSIVGDDIDFTTALGSRHLLASGWSATEEGLGVWSDGARASLSFNLADVPAAPLVLEVIGRPFIAPRHENLTIHVSAGATPVANWHFGPPGSPVRGANETRCATIPAALAAARPLRIDLAFDFPASPAELGMSADPRRLGLLLHSLRFRPETATPPAI